MRELKTLTYDELRDLGSWVDSIARDVLQTDPKKRTAVQNASLAYCRKMWIEIHNQTCAELCQQAQKARESRRIK